MAAEMAANKEVEILMKGSLHTDELLKAVLSHKALRTGRRLSHVFRFDVPLYPKPLIITDAAINIEPTLQEKVDIVQNAIDFARVMGIETPKVAILSAVETVTASIPSTLDAAALCKMADRGQITGGLLMARWRLTTPSRPMRCRSKASFLKWLGRLTFWPCPIWKAAT